VFEHAIEKVNAGGAALDFDFGHDGWLRALEPADAAAGTASFDGMSLALPEQPTLTVPEAGGPASVNQTGPYTMTGLAWAKDPLNGPPAASNGLTLKLTGTRAATLSARGAGLDPAKPLKATVTTDHALDLTLRGRWHGTPTANVPLDATPAAITLHVPA